MVWCGYRTVWRRQHPGHRIRPRCAWTPTTAGAAAAGVEPVMAGKSNPLMRLPVYVPTTCCAASTSCRSLLARVLEAEPGQREQPVSCAGRRRRRRLRALHLHRGHHCCEALCLARRPLRQIYRCRRCHFRFCLRLVSRGGSLRAPASAHCFHRPPPLAAALAARLGRVAAASASAPSGLSASRSRFLTPRVPSLSADARC